MSKPRTSYKGSVEPHMDLIREMRLQGYKEEDIAKRLDIANSTWYKYKNIYPEFAEVLKESKEGLVGNLEKSMFQLAMGGYTSTKITRKHVEVNGVIKDDTIEVTETVTEHTPQATPLIFSLKNLAPDKWADKVEQVDSKTMVEFTKQFTELVDKL